MSDSHEELPDADAASADAIIHGVDDAPSALDQQRWHALADNAAYYRDNVRVADRIASWVRVQPPAEVPAD